MSSSKPSQYNFKYAKPVVESTNNNNNRLLSPARPKPSPSKREIMMQELGLDEADDALSDSSESITFSSDDEDVTQTIGGPTQAEFDALQKDRDQLLVNNREMSDQLRHYKGLLYREEKKRNRHVKILKKAQGDILQDRDRLITNLEDVVFDGEQKIKQLEDDLKGNPIKPTIEPVSQVSSIQKLVDNIKSLHKEKASLSEQVINLEQDLEDKSNEILNLRENVDLSNQNFRNGNSQTDNEKVVAKLKSEIHDVKHLLSEREGELVTERENVNSISDKLDRLEKKMKKLEDDKKKSEKKSRVEIERLIKEVENKNKEVFELENKPPEVVTKMIEKVVEVESSEQKSEISEARIKVQNMESAIREMERASKKAKDEIMRLREQVNKYQQDLSESRAEAEDTNSTHLEEEAKLRTELRQRESDLSSEKKAMEKMRKSVNKEKDKVSDLERELQELKASSKMSKSEFLSEIETLKKRMRQQEEDLCQELKDANDAAEEQKIDSERSIERLESKIRKTEDKLHKLKESNQDLNLKYTDSTRKLESLSDELETKEDELNSLKSNNFTLESNLSQEKQKVTDYQQKLDASNALNETLQTQVKDLSGASDVATVELSNLKMENSSLKIELDRLKSAADKLRNDIQITEVKKSKLREELNNVQAQLAENKTFHEKELATLEEKHSKALHDMKTSSSAELHAVNSKFYKLQCSLRHILSTVHIIAKENQHLKKECSKFPDLIEETMCQAEKNINNAISEMNDNSKELIRRYKKEMQLRKKYHNELVELKGNIRVFARVRPTISEDGSGAQAKNAVTYDRDDDGMIYVHNSARGRSTLFELDKVFQPDSTQLEVYSEVQSLVTSCIDGYHVCIFAYGQTGSGKTYTMEGPSTNPGINQRALKDLFSDMEDKSKDWEFEVSVSLVEIYNEALKDLLNSKSSVEKLEIKMNADGSLYVPGLVCKPVKNLDDVNELFALGHSNRATASTNMNEHSSRSHAVLMVYINGYNPTTGTKTFGKLNLIDLAGSERVSKSGASGARLKEAQNINKSLSALGDVIQALGAKQSHIPFRNSKLTYLLQDSLSKDSKTLMLVQVAPVEKNVSETICSLSFAQRVRKVELGQANKKVEEKADDGTPKKLLKNSQLVKKK